MRETRLSTLDASFLTVESPAAHMHVGWAALFGAPDAGPPSFEQLREHIGSRMARAPRYRQRLAEVPFGVNDPVWIDDEDFDVSRHVRHSDSRDFGEIADRVMSNQLDRDRPLWELWIADGLPDGRLGVIGKAHHCMADGLAAVELATLLLDPTPLPPEPDQDGWRPASAPGGPQLLVDGIVDRVGEALHLARSPLKLLSSPQRVVGAANDVIRTARASVTSLRSATPETGLNEPISAGRHLARCAGRWPTSSASRTSSAPR